MHYLSCRCAQQYSPYKLISIVGNIDWINSSASVSTFSSSVVTFLDDNVPVVRSIVVNLENGWEQMRENHVYRRDDAAREQVCNSYERT